MTPARTAAAACAAGRWISAGALLLIVAVLVVHALHPPAGLASGALLVGGLAVGALQLYLAARIDFDRRIFEAVAAEHDAQAAFVAFDQSRLALGLGQLPQARTPEQRAAGAVGLVRWSGILLLAQLAFVAAAMLVLA